MNSSSSRYDRPRFAQILPRRTASRRRDRHGRRPRGPALPPGLPGWRTRAEIFEDMLRREVIFLSRNVPGQLDRVEFAVEDVPPSDPAPWEGNAAPFGRFFPADRMAGIPARVVLYRRPLQIRARSRYELEYLVHVVVCEQLSAGLGIAMTDLDPRWR